MGLKGKNPKTAASHDTPVTVAAETGLPGLALFAALLVAVFISAYRRRRRSLAVVTGLGLAAILCHSLFYNAFFEDPMMWGLLGLAAIAAPALAPSEPEPEPLPAPEAVPA